MPKTKMPIIRAADGTVINIGRWDYQIAWVPATTPDGAPIFDQLPEGGFVQRIEQRAMNPLPPGAYEDEAEVTVLPDGGLRAE